MLLAFGLGQIPYVAAVSGADFGMTASQNFLAVNVGATGTSVIALLGLSGLTNNVTVTAVVSPQSAGLAASLSPATVSLGSTGHGVTTLQVSTMAGTPQGMYSINVIGTAGSLTHSVVVTLAVIAGPATGGGMSSRAMSSSTPTVTTIITGGFPAGVAVDQKTNTVYVSDFDGQGIFVIRNNSFVGNILNNIGAMQGIAFNPSTDTLYASSGITGLLYVVDVKTNTLATTVPIGREPRHIAVNPVTNRIYVTNDFTNAVSVVDGATNTILANIAVDSSPLGVAVNPNTNTVYVANELPGSEVTVINGATNSIIKTVQVFGYPVTVVADPTTNTIYVSNLGGCDAGGCLASLSIIDGSTNTLTSSIPVPLNEVNLFGLDESQVTKQIFSASYTSNLVYFADPITRTITDRFPISSNGPFDMRLNPSTGLLYVANILSGSVSVITTPAPPPPSIHVSKFYTDGNNNPLATDALGNPKVDVVLAGGKVRSTNPGQILGWVNVTNTAHLPLQSLTLNDTLPVDWAVSPQWNPGQGAIHVFYGNTTGPEITQPSTVTVSNANPQTLNLRIPGLDGTAIGHSLLPGQSVLMSVKMGYGLDRTAQNRTSYPRNYTDTAAVAAWTMANFTGNHFVGSGSASFKAYAKLLGDLNGDFKVDIMDLALAAYSFGSTPGSANWNPNADLNIDGTVDIGDLALIAFYFGTSG